MNPIRLAKNWLSYRRTVSELSNLPSHTLSDIGLTRYDIRWLLPARHDEPHGRLMHVLNGASGRAVLILSGSVEPES